MTKVRYQDPFFQVESTSGAAIPNGQLFFFAAGTTTLNDTFQDEALTLANTNPVIADGSGRFPVIYMKSQVYTVKMTDADGVNIKTADFDATEPSVTPAATTTIPGKAELATLAEVRTGSDTSRIVTPEGVDEAKKALRSNREETGTSFTLLETDAGRTIYANNANPITVTVNSSVNLADQIVFIRQKGAGQVTISAGTATVNSANGLKTQAQNSKISIEFETASLAYVDGDAVA